MSTPEITPALRQAVYEADCKEQGHIYDLMIGYELDDVNVLVGRPDGHGDTDDLPHIRCRRCRRVWLVVPDSPGLDYEDAEERVTKRVRKEDSLQGIVVDRRERRRKRREREQARERGTG